MSDEPFRLWMRELQSGNDSATERLWNEYFSRLVRLASSQLPAGVRREFDEEDVALSAIQSFCQGLGRERFPRLHSQDNLWALLVLITSRKVSRHIRRQMTQKRGGGDARGESAFGANGGIAAVIAEGPSAEFASRLFEETEQLFHVLEDDGLRQLARLKMEGLANHEVATRLGCAERTVERRLVLIRKLWTERVTSGPQT